jgi:hypothetical protein
MTFTSQDIALIEKALHTIIQIEGNEQKKNEYKEVLIKLQNSVQQGLYNHSCPMVEHSNSFRYGFDDYSEF